MNIRLSNVSPVTPGLPAHYFCLIDINGVVATIERPTKAEAEAAHAALAGAKMTAGR